MAAFTCDVCGGKVVSSGKQGWFVCENCGSEYPTEWMKAKYQNSKVVQVKGIATVENLLIRARQFFEQKDYDKAEEYCDKVLDIDAENDEAKEIIKAIDSAREKRRLAEEQIEKAKEFMEAGDFQKAEEIIAPALHHFPNDDDIRYQFDLLQSLKKVKFEGQTLISYQGEDSVFSIPYGITAIGDFAFAKKDGKGNNLRTVYIPESVVSIGNNAFERCEQLETVYWGGYSSQPSCIGGYAFHGCTKLKEFSFPCYLLSIGKSAFEGCINLSGEVSISNIYTLGARAFYGCRSIHKIVLGSNAGSENGELGLDSLATTGNTIIEGSWVTYDRLANAGVESAKKQLKQWQIDKEMAEAAKRKDWIRRGQCQYCGGTFKGFFKKCARCGRPKDY